MDFDRSPIENRHSEITCLLFTTVKKGSLGYSEAELKQNKKKMVWRYIDMVERELPTKFGLDPCSGF